MKRIKHDDLTVRALSIAYRHGSVPLVVTRSLCASTSASLQANSDVVVHFSGEQTPRTTTALARLEASTVVIRADYAPMQNEANPAAHAGRITVFGGLDVGGRFDKLRVVHLCSLDTTADVLRRFCAALPALDAFHITSVLSPRELFTPQKTTKCVVDVMDCPETFDLTFGDDIRDISLRWIRLTSAPAFPATLERLSLCCVDCDDAIIIPEGVAFAEVQHSDADLLRLPDSLAELVFEGEEAYTALPEYFPSRLRKLDLQSWQIKLKPHSLPDGLLYLSVPVDSELEGVRLPTSLVRLTGPLDGVNLSALTRLRELSGTIWRDANLLSSLPPSIESVDVTYQCLVDTTVDLAACERLTRFQVRSERAYVTLTGFQNASRMQVIKHKCILIFARRT